MTNTSTPTEAMEKLNGLIKMMESYRVEIQQIGMQKEVEREFTHCLIRDFPEIANLCEQLYKDNQIMREALEESQKCIKTMSYYIPHTKLCMELKSGKHLVEVIKDAQSKNEQTLSQVSDYPKPE